MTEPTESTQPAVEAAAAARAAVLETYLATAQRELDRVDDVLVWKGLGKGRIDRVEELLAAERALAEMRAALAAATEHMIWMTGAWNIAPDDEATVRMREGINAALAALQTMGAARNA